MALDIKEKRASAMMVGLPFRMPSVDPTRSGFDSLSRAAAIGIYAFGSSITWDDLVSESNATFIRHYASIGSANVLDSQSGDNGTVVGTVEYTSSARGLGQAFVFSTGNYFTIPLVTLDGDFTVDYTFAGSDASGRHLGYSNNDFRFVQNSKTEIGLRVSSTNLHYFTVPDLGSDRHRATYTRAGSLFSCYLDGELIGTSTMADTIYLNRCGAAGGTVFNGILDEIRILNRAYTAQEAAVSAAGPIPTTHPQLIVEPSITGNVNIGSTVTAYDGLWDGGTTTARQWRKADDALGTGAASISGETGATYEISDSDVDEGDYLSVRITRTNIIGDATEDSEWQEIGDEAPPLTWEELAEDAALELRLAPTTGNDNFLDLSTHARHGTEVGDVTFVDNSRYPNVDMRNYVFSDGAYVTHPTISFLAGQEMTLLATLLVNNSSGRITGYLTASNPRLNKLSNTNHTYSTAAGSASFTHPSVGQTTAYRLAFRRKSTNVCDMWINGVPANENGGAVALAQIMAFDRLARSSTVSIPSGSQIGDYRLYSRALTDEEIATDYNGPTGSGFIFVNYPPTNGFIPRNTPTTGQGHYELEYIGTPESISVIVDDGDPVVIDANPSGNASSGLLPVMERGNHRLRFVFTENPAVSTTVNEVSVGAVFVLPYQSNNEGRLEHNQVYDDSLFRSYVLRSTGVIEPLADPIGRTGAKGCWFIPFANRYVRRFKEPVLVIDPAKGGTDLGINGWAKNATGGSANYYNTAIQLLSLVTDFPVPMGVVSIWWGGETYAANGTDYATILAETGQCANDWHADTGCKMAMIGILDITAPAEDIANVRAANEYLDANNDNFVLLADLEGILSDDSYHVIDDETAVLVVDRIWNGFIRSEFATAPVRKTRNYYYQQLMAG